MFLIIWHRKRLSDLWAVTPSAEYNHHISSEPPRQEIVTWQGGRKWLETSETSSASLFPLFYIRRQSFTVHCPRNRVEETVLHLFPKKLTAHQKQTLLYFLLYSFFSSVFFLHQSCLTAVEKNQVFRITHAFIATAIVLSHEHNCSKLEGENKSPFVPASEIKSTRYTHNLTRKYGKFPYVTLTTWNLNISFSLCNAQHLSY